MGKFWLSIPERGICEISLLAEYSKGHHHYYNIIQTISTSTTLVRQWKKG